MANISSVKITIVVLILSMIIVQAPVSTYAGGGTKPNYIENTYRFVMMTDTDMAVIGFGPSPGELLAVSNGRLQLYTLRNNLLSQDKDVGVFDVYLKIWSHYYDTNWLHDETLNAITSASGESALIVFAHANPYGIQVFRFRYLIAAVNGYPTPTWWAIPSSVYISAYDVGNVIRNKPVWQIPSLIVMLGCNSGGYGSPAYGESSWLWAFRFDESDYPYYWYGRGFIGFLTKIWLPNTEEPASFKFIRKVLEYAINQGFDLGEAVEQAANTLQYSVHMDYVSGWSRHQKDINFNNGEKALFVGGYYTVVDPNLKDKLIQASLDYLKTNMPQLYNVVTSYGIRPVVEKDLEFKKINYTSYIVEWSVKGKIYIMTRVITDGNKFFVVSVYTRLSKDVIDRGEISKLINDNYSLINNSIDELKRLGFSINCSGGFILYNNTPVILLRDNGVWMTRVYFEFEEHVNSYMLFYDNYMEFLKEVLRDNRSTPPKWRISEGQALNVATKNSPFKNLDNITYSIRRYIVVLDNGLYPMYQVKLIYNDQYYEAYVNAYDGKLLSSSEGEIIGIDNNNWNVILGQTPLWVYLGITIVLVFALILISRRIIKSK